jgi:hypothetical protein
VNASGALSFSLLVWVLGLVTLYWVVRLAVRHGIEDADRRRNRPAYRANSLPTHPAGRPPTSPGAD